MVHYFNPPFTSKQSYLRQNKKRKHAATESENALDESENSENTQGSSPQNSKVTSHTLREQHLNAVNAVMHRSLLKGDFERAGRAWAILLRAEVNGRPYDVRPQSRWGIGAEILLRGHHNTNDHQVQEGKISRKDLSIRGSLRDVTLNGIADARAFYDRLILQYPARKYDSKTVDSATFYPVMFGLWVYEVKLQSEQAMKTMIERPFFCSVHNELLEDFKSDLNHKGRKLDRNWCSPQSIPHEHVQGHADTAETAQSMRSEQIKAIRATELKGAKEIAERIDETISSPPHDKNKDLLQLRDMTALWIGSLIDQISKEINITNDASTFQESLFEEEEGQEEEEDDE